MSHRWFWYTGIVAVVVYILALVIGGMLYPNYSHISQDVSQLTSTHSPIRGFMSIFCIYNVFVAVFGIGLYRLSSKKIAQLGSSLVIAIGLLGILINWFPVNTRGTPLTSVGYIHIVIVSVISLFTIVSDFLLWRALRKTKYDTVASISGTAGFLFLVTGPIAAVQVMSPYAGLYERIPIGIFLSWILFCSLSLLKIK